MEIPKENERIHQPVAVFPNEEYTPEQALLWAQNQQDWDGVIIMGYNKEGHFVDVIGGDMTRGKIVYACETLKHRAMFHE